MTALGLLLVTLAGSAACARAFQVGSEPAPVYRITLANDFGEAMVVSYNDGQGDRILGAIPAGRSDTFVVAAPAASSITISARNSTSTTRYGPATVALVLGEIVTHRIRP
jgi:hypothetical protein